MNEDEEREIMFLCHGRLDKQKNLPSSLYHPSLIHKNQNHTFFFFFYIGKKLSAAAIFCKFARKKEKRKQKPNKQKKQKKHNNFYAQKFNVKAT